MWPPSGDDTCFQDTYVRLIGLLGSAVKGRAVSRVFDYPRRRPAREAHADQCAFAAAARIQPERSLMAFGDFGDDGEAEPAAALSAAEHAVETFEHTFAV